MKCRLLPDLQHDLSHLLSRFQTLLRLAGLSQRVGAVNCGYERPSKHQIHYRGEVTVRAHRRTEQRQVLAKNEAVVDLDLGPGGVAHREDTPAFTRSPEAQRE